MQGKNYEAAKSLIKDAIALEKSGVFSLILEAVPVKLANYITEKISIPTIGTGSGAGCDGQNLITPDLLGFYDDSFCPKYVKRYADLNSIIYQALTKYVEEVKAQTFPAKENTYQLKNDNFLDDLFKEM